MGELSNSVYKATRKDAWNKFVISLNSRTQINKVWDNFRKVNGHYNPRTIPSWERRGNMITSPDNIAGQYLNI